MIVYISARCFYSLSDGMNYWPWIKTKRYILEILLKFDWEGKGTIISCNRRYGKGVTREEKRKKQITLSIPNIFNFSCFRDRHNPNSVFYLDGRYYSLSFIVDIAVHHFLSQEDHSISPYPLYWTPPGHSHSSEITELPIIILTFSSAIFLEQGSH